MNTRGQDQTPAKLRGGNRTKKSERKEQWATARQLLQQRRDERDAKLKLRPSHYRVVDGKIYFVGRRQKGPSQQRPAGYWNFVTGKVAGINYALIEKCFPLLMRFMEKPQVTVLPTAEIKEAA